MAHRHKRRARASARRNPPRHRRSVRRVLRANPPHRRQKHRRGRVAANPPHRRRRFRRNPPISGLVRSIVQGVTDGAGVVVGQVATRKAVGAIQGAAKLTAPTAMTKIALNFGAAAAVTLLARKALPSKFQSSARFVAAGAFAEAINVALAQTPAAPFLSAFPRRVRGMGALGPVRGVRAPGVGAYTAPLALPGRTGMGAYTRVLPLPAQVG